MTTERHPSYGRVLPDAPIGSALASIDENLARVRMLLDQAKERDFQRGRLSPDAARAWRLSPERWEAIEAGVIEADEREEPAPVVSLCDRRASRVPGGA